MTFVASKTDPPYEVWSGPDPLGALVASNRMARTDAQRMAGSDVNRTSRIALRMSHLVDRGPTRSPREGPESVSEPPFDRGA